MMAISTLVMAASCSGNSNRNESIDSATETYHADNDIAMTILSIADAIRVGEPLDTADYEFEGVLTDGQGHPLYTDVQGAPGTWDIDVISPTSVIIKNIYPGDLLPDDLCTYLTTSLGLTADDIVETTQYDDDDETSLTVYDFNGGYLRIETRAAVSANGLEGPLMRIIATKTAPHFI